MVHIDQFEETPMLVKVNILCNDFMISGKVDVPKVKKCFGKKHFGLTALLNFPKLNANWPFGDPKKITIEDAKVKHRDWRRSKKIGTTEIPTSAIVCGWQDDSKERIHYENHFEQMISMNDRLAFDTTTGLRIEGEFINELNEVNTSKGQGFVCLANTFMRDDSNKEVTPLPFLVINQKYLRHQSHPTQYLTQQAVNEKLPLANCS